MRKIKNKKYHYFYKITNLINNHFYYGIHSTNDLEDGYMGSGTRLHKAYEKYGIENFKKEILKFFDSREECAEYEMEMVTEKLVNDNDCYNIILGGDTFSTSGTITAKDKDGNYLQVSKYDKRWLSGELVGSTKGFTNCYDLYNKQYVQVSNNDFINNKDRYKGLTFDCVVVKLKNDDKYFLVPKEEYNKNKHLYVTFTTNKVAVKDKMGNYYSVDKDDPRLLSGELINMWRGRNHSIETKRKISATQKNNKHQQGEKNSQYGTCWINNGKENKKIKRIELETYLSIGWVKGRKMKFNKLES